MSGEGTAISFNWKSERDMIGNAMSERKAED